MSDDLKLIQRLRDAARSLYGGESGEALIDPIACLLEAADRLETESTLTAPITTDEPVTVQYQEGQYSDLS